MKIRAGAGNNNALAFVSRHQEVEVYAGGRLIYYIKAHSSILEQPLELIIRL